MIGASHIHHDIQGRVAIEATKLSTQLDGLTLVNFGGKMATRDAHVYGSNHK